MHPGGSPWLIHVIWIFHPIPAMLQCHSQILVQSRAADEDDEEDELDEEPPQSV